MMQSHVSRTLFLFLTKNLSVRRFSSDVHVEKYPLMVNQVLKQLNISDGQTVLDMTFGAGLHSEAILERCSNVNVIALDRDPCAFQVAEGLAQRYPERIKPFLGRFSDIPNLLESMGLQRNSLDAILIDVGCSSLQLNEAARGFSPEKDGPLDMRMDGTSSSDSITAQDVIQKADEDDLRRLFRLYGGEEQAKKIAKFLVTCRYTLHSLDSTFKFKDFLSSICEDRPNRAIKNVFYALRTFVNNELNELNYAMFLSGELLKKEGRLVTLTFNQAEDTIVKRHISGNVMENSPNPIPLKYYSHMCNLSSDEINNLRQSKWVPLTKHVITASQEEILVNFRSKGAKLRSAVKA